MTSTAAQPRTSCRARVSRIFTLATVAALLVAACSDDGTSTASSATASSATTTIAGDTSTSSATSTSTSASTGSSTPTSAPTSSPTSSTLAGEPWDGFADEGDLLGVFGVAADDVLNVRVAPGTDQEIVATAPPTADDLEATGRARMLPNSFWYEITVDGETGWASVMFTGFIGGTDDATAEFLDGRDPIQAETMTDLGTEVADGFASDDPPSRIEQSVAPTVGDLGEVTYDVVGIGDDAIAGFRLHVFGAPSESGEGFVLKSIERTVFCSRGLAGELCT